MNIVPITAAPKARAPNAPALRASRSYRTTRAITRSAKPRIDTTLLTAWVGVRTYALRGPISAGVVKRITSRVMIISAPATIAIGAP
jgi:hypothetical protein